jgi:hypothetical protein
MQDILQNLTQLAENCKNRKTVRGFLTDLKKALGIGGKSSDYKYFTTKDVKCSIRISNHNAKAYRYIGRKNETYYNTSIVIKSSRKTPNTFEPDNKIIIEEFVYFRPDLEDNNDLFPLIVEGIIELLLSGRYIDKTGIAKQNYSPTKQNGKNLSGMITEVYDFAQDVIIKHRDKLLSTNDLRPAIVSLLEKEGVIEEYQKYWSENKRNQYVVKLEYFIDGLVDWFKLYKILHSFPEPDPQTQPHFAQMVNFIKSKGGKHLINRLSTAYSEYKKESEFNNIPETIAYEFRDFGYQFPKRWILIEKYANDDKNKFNSWFNGLKSRVNQAQIAETAYRAAKADNYYNILANRLLFDEILLYMVKKRGLQTMAG